MMFFGVNTHDFMPHGHCIFWTPVILFPMVAADIIIFLSYFSIPLSMTIFLKRRKDLSNKLKIVITLFVLFILLCGVTHIISAWNYWNSDYVLEVLVKILTAIVSMVTAIVCFFNMKELLKIPSPEEFKVQNEKLKDLNRNLEVKVESRTKEIDKIKKQFQDLFELSPTGLIMVDSKGCIVKANHEFASMFSYTVEEVTGMSVHHLVPKNQREVHIKYFEKFMKKPEKRGMGSSQSLSGLRKDFSQFPVEVGLNPLLSDRESFVIASVLDKTAIIKKEESIKELNNNLVKKNKELEQFVYTVSHDLKTPIVSIEEFIKRLIKENSEKGSVLNVDFFERIKKNIENQKKLITSLLDISKITHQSVTIEKKNIYESILKSVNLFEREIEKYGATINIKKDYPLLNLNQPMVTQLFNNLLSNSIKYRSKERNLLISIGIESIDKNTVTIYYKDNALGFPDFAIVNAFKIFERFHPEVKDGTGVGLAIVKKIIEKHDADIWINSKENIGSTFFMRFKLN